MRTRRHRWLRLPLSVLVRGGGWFVFWIALTKGEAAALAFGVPIALVASLVSLRVLPPARVWNVWRLPGFLARFFGQSFLASLDVALRAAARRPAIAPGVFTCQLRLESPAARALLSDVMSLAPGSLSADLQGSTLTVHVLDRSQDVELEIRRLEADIRAILPGTGR